jgi:Type IV leader peptidase family
VLPFWLSIGALSLVQAALVAAPSAVAWPPLLRLRSRWLALVLPLSIVVVIAAIAAESAVADFLSYLALVAVPPLAAVALAWLIRGARPPLALLAVPLFALAWAVKGELGGRSAALALSALACVTLGWLLATVVPGRWLKLGIYAMAAIDAYLVGSDLLQQPNSVLNTAAPGADLPRLQLVHFGTAVMGFGDIFIAAVLGALLAHNRRLQLTGAAIAAVIGIAFDCLFFAVDELPATVPIALTLAVLELLERRRAIPA